MKNLLFMAAVAATLASCSTNNEDFVTMNEVQKITFDAPVMNKNGRAAITDTKYPEAEKFKVFAQRTTGEYQTGWDNNFMNGVEVSKVQTETYWAPAADYFWPKNGDVISFAAYSPSSLANGTGCTNVEYSTAGLKVTDYQLDAALNDQKDLMYAPRVLNQTKTGNTTGVDLTFKHALSLINFTVKSDNSGITVTDIIVSNAKDKGTFSETITDGSSYSSTPVWSDQALQGASSSFKVFTGNQAITASLAAQALGGNLLMIPQTIESSTTPQTLTVKWKYTNGGNTEVLDEITKNFSDLSTTTWEIGKKYTYNITINLDKIYFNPSVTDWEAGSTVEVKP